jgi:hypothetical protein
VVFELDLDTKVGSRQLNLKSGVMKDVLDRGDLEETQRKEHKPCVVCILVWLKHRPYKKMCWDILLEKLVEARL